MNDDLKQFLELPDDLGNKYVIGHGDIAVKAKLEELYPNVVFTGYANNGQLAMLLANIDVLVSPLSLISILKANACGTPVASIPAHGVEAHIVDHLNGVVDDDLSIAVINAVTLDRKKIRQYIEEL